MENFNRSNRPGRERNFDRRGFNNRDSGRPSVMYKADCSRCGKDCELPFKPTSNRPVFCSSCFESNRNTEGATNFNDRQLYDAVCDECGNSCQVPFRPSNGKPIYCSNCFGDKKEGRNRNRDTFRPQLQNKTDFISDNKEQFEQLNSKLDKILLLLSPKDLVKPVQKTPEEDTIAPQPEVKTIKTKEVKKVTKKRAPKKNG